MVSVSACFSERKAVRGVAAEIPAAKRAVVGGDCVSYAIFVSPGYFRAYRHG